MTSVQRFISNDRNYVAGAAATLSASSTKVSKSIRQIFTNRSGNGRVVLGGNYTGNENAAIEVEILGGGAVPRTTVPAFSGVGSGALSVVSVDGGATPQTLTFTLNDMGTVTEYASLVVHNISIRSKASGAAGNSINLKVAQSLTKTATSWALLAPWPESQKTQQGEQWAFGALPLLENGELDPATPRISFGNDVEVYRPYRERVGGVWYIGMSPPLKSDIPEDTVVWKITGGYVVTVTSGATVETYGSSPALVTMHDLITALSTSALVDVIGVTQADRSPSGVAAIDIPLKTYAWILKQAGEVKLADVSATANAPTEKVVVTCLNADVVGLETWSVIGPVSGDMGLAKTGEEFEGAINFTIPKIAAASQGEGSTKWKWNPAARAEGDTGIPSVCIKPLLLGVSAKPKTLTFTYELRPNDSSCDCTKKSASGRITKECLGLEYIDMPTTFTGTALTRLKDLYGWAADTVRSNSYYAGNPTSGLPRVEPFVEDLRNMVSEFEATLLDVVGDTDAETAWDTAVTELKSDVDMYLEEYKRLTTIDAPTSLLIAEEALATGDAVSMVVTKVTSETITATAVGGIMQSGSATHSIVYFWMDAGDWKCSETLPYSVIATDTEYFYGFVYGTVADSSPATVTMSGPVLVAFSGNTELHIPAGTQLFASAGTASVVSAGAGFGVIASAEKVPYDTEIAVVLPPGTFASVSAARKAAPNDSKYGFVKAPVSKGDPATVYWYGENTGLSGLVLGDQYMPSLGAPGTWVPYDSDYDITKGSIEAIASGTTSLTITGNGDTPGADIYNIHGEGLINERHRARLAHVYVCAGMSPKSSASGIGAGDGCWQDDPSATHWWVETSGDYFPAFTNKMYVSSQQSCGSGASANVPMGQPYSTKEFGFGVVVDCEDRLKVGDSFTIKIEAADGEKPYKVGAKAEVSVVAGSAAFLAGGVTGNDTLTWGVLGSVSGNLPDYSLTTSELAYHNGGAKVSIKRGGIPFSLGDVFSLAIESGQFKWRKDVGAWSAATDIIDGPIILSDGLTAEFVSGRAPSYIAADSWSFVAEQPNAPSGVKSPSMGRWYWTGATANLVIALGASKTINTLALADYYFPAGAVVTMEGGDGSSWPKSQVMDVTSPVSVFILSTAWTVTHLRLTITAAVGGGIGWVWAGQPLTTNRDADSCVVSRKWAIERGSGSNPASLYTGSGFDSELGWDSSLTNSDVSNLISMMDYLAVNSEPLILVPHHLHPKEAMLVRVEEDYVSIEDFHQYQPNDDGHRLISMKLPLKAVLA